MKSLMQKFSKALLLMPAMVVGLSFASVDVASAQDCSADQGVSGGVSCAQPSGVQEDLFGEGSIFQTITNILLFLIGAVSVVMLIIGGVRYVVSNGDQSAITSAKNTILYAIIGIIVAFLAFAAVRFITDQFNSSAYLESTSEVAVIE